MTNRLLCAAFAIATTASTLHAAEGVGITVEPYLRYAFDADLDDTDASVSLARGGVNVRFDKQFSEATIGQVKLLGEYSHYDFDNTADLLDDGINLEVRPAVFTYLNPDLNVYGGVIIGAGGESDADVSSSLYYGGFIGVSYQVRSGVWIGGGVGVQTELEDSPLIVPLVTLQWQINDRWTLEADGLNAKLSYAINDEWSVFVDGRYEFRQFRLDEDNVVPEGVLSDESVPVSFGVTYKPQPTFSAFAAVGVVAWREFEVLDEDGDDAATTEADPTAFVALGLKWAF